MGPTGYGHSSLVFAGILISVIGGKGPVLGIEDNRLKPCPRSPNCVSSYQKNGSHYVEPLYFKGKKEDALKTLLSVIKSMKRMKIILSDVHYIHAECKSLFFKFVDDIEFYFDKSDRVIHIRSASRIGYSDLGANKKRVEAIRQQFYELI